MGASLKHTFSAPLIKIARARKHLAELEEEIGVFLSTEPARLRRRVVSGTPEPPLQLRIVLPPEHLGAIIGDIVHNLRAALDLVACDMVRAVEGKTQTLSEYISRFAKGLRILRA